MPDLEYMYEKLEKAKSHAQRMMQSCPVDSHQVIMAKMDVSYWEYHILRISHQH